MANKELLGNQYKIPSDVIKAIQAALVTYPNKEGIKRAKMAVNNGYLTYETMKRFKNFFDTFNLNIQEKSQYELAGGSLMRKFIETTLNNERTAIKNSKKTKELYSTNPNSELMPYQNPKLNENLDDDTINRMSDFGLSEEECCRGFGEADKRARKTKRRGTE